MRAWRGLGSFEPRSPVSAWLYRIATNVCLRMVEQRSRNPAATVDGHLQPYPEALLEEIPSGEPGPDVHLEEAEAIGLAFVTALQLLPPKQRVVVVLRDALGWSARDVADFLDDTVPAVNSALQRARARLKRERRERTITRAHTPVDRATEDRVIGRFLEAWAAIDIPALVTLLADDALLTMPPEAMRVEGSRQIGEFFATAPLEGQLDRIRLVSTRANRQPALAAYAQERDGGTFDPYGVMVFAIAGEQICGIVGFPQQPELFARLGLPGRLDA